MFETFTDTELHKMELRCLDLLTHHDGLKRANAQVMITYVRTEIEHRALSRKDEPRDRRGIHLAPRAWK